MNPRLSLLHRYPFERLRALFEGIGPPAALAPINFGIGEPRHATPQLIVEALASSSAALANYPTTAGPLALRESIARWLARRHGLPALDPATEVLPVLGSREALFGFAQVVVDASRNAPVVVVPNPFYQIYEGAALLAGAEVHCVAGDPARGFAQDFDAVPAGVWQRTQLVYVCSPDNPTGHVIDLEGWRRLFALADRHGFAIASDECYSEVYLDEALPPLGALGAARALGRGHRGVVVFGSLSKRSNAPGLRSGYAAGDAALVQAFLRYRTYHGSAMSGMVAAASLAAWNDEAHVVANRARYAAKFRELVPRVAALLPCTAPQGGFYLWAEVGGDDAAFARDLYAAANVTVLPGSYLGREAGGVNPGAGRIRLALVADEAECREGVERLLDFARQR